MCRSYDASFLSAIVSPSLSLSLGCPVYVHASSTFVFVGLVCNFCFEAGYFALTMSPRVSYFVCVSSLVFSCMPVCLHCHRHALFYFIYMQACWVLAVLQWVYHHLGSFAVCSLCVAVADLPRCVNQHTRINMTSQLTSYALKSMPPCQKDPIKCSVNHVLQCAGCEPSLCLSWQHECITHCACVFTV